MVAKVHKDIPGAKVLAYFDAVDIPIIKGCSTGSPMGTNPVQRPLPDDPTGYYKELRANFNLSWLVRRRSTMTTPRELLHEGVRRSLFLY